MDFNQFFSWFLISFYWSLIIYEIVIGIFNLFDYAK